MNKELSRKIFQRLAEKDENISKSLNQKDIENILQELDVYQAELLAQNEELIEKQYELYESKHEYEVLFNDSTIAYIIVDKNLNIEKYNMLSLQSFNIYSPSNKVKSILSFINSKSLNKFLTWINKENYLNESINIDMNCNYAGITRYKVDAKKYSLKDDCIMLSFTNVENEYRLIDELNFANDAFDIVLSSYSANIVLLNDKFRIIKYSKNAKNFFHIHEHAIRFIDSIIDCNKDLENLNKNIIEVLDTGIKQDTEIVIKQRVYWLSIQRIVSTQSRIVDSEYSIVITLLDKTDIVQKEKMLFTQSKMSSMGDLLSNIAHQWRQPLNALSALNIKLSMTYNKDGLTKKDMNEFLDKSNQFIQNMSRVIDKFNNFFRKDDLMRDFNLNQVVNESLGFLDEQFQRNSIIVTNTIDEKIFLNNYKYEFAQVLLNILNNSKEAILGNSIKNAKIVISAQEDNTKVVISIQDNGRGIDEKIINQVFDPYFSTKLQSSGIGLGLYISKMIIEQSLKGSINIENNKNGVLVKITLNKK
jgi:signal transduction histidine kinase